MGALTGILVVTLSLGPVLALIGFLLQKFPPKRINHFYGYRTPGSMKSQERWDFAQTYSAKELMKLGVTITLLSAVLFWHPTDTMVALLGATTGVGVIIVIVRVERALNKRFP